MAKKLSFSILGDIANASDIAEVGYNYSFKGKTLQQGSVGADGSFTINFTNKNKSVKGVIEFEKLNATGSGNFTNNSIEYSLASDEFSIFKANAKKSPQAFTYSFSLDNPVTPNPPNPEANRIALSTFQDIYSNTQGGQVIGGTFTPNNERFTQGQNIVTATVGTLGQEDSLIDPQQGDNDQLNLSTASGTNGFGRAMTDIATLAGIESINVTANADPTTIANLDKVSGLESLSLSGSFNSRVRLNNYLDTGARRFDFSGMTTGGVQFGNNNNDFVTENLVVKGSADDDILKASLGQATIEGGSGSDAITGSSQSSGFYAGQLGQDGIQLLANNTQDTVSLVGITSVANADEIIGFAGAATVANGFDLLQFDAATFSNFTAGATVSLIDRQEAVSRRGNAAALKNTVFFVNNVQDLDLVNLQNGAGSLAIVLGSETLVYSANGDFTNNRFQAIAGIDNIANLTGANFSIV
jgi:hypothetical protein